MNEPILAKWLRWLVYACALVPLVIFSQYLSPFHFGKVVVFRSLVQTMLALYLLLIWRDRSYLPKSNPITWAFVAFTAVFTLTTLTSVARLQSFWGTLERMGGLWTFWHYLIFYLIMVAVLRTQAHWRALFNIMIVAGVLSALYGFLQKTSWTWIIGSGGRQRIFGTIGNPALFAGYQILVAYLAATLALFKTTTRGWRKWYLFAAALTLVAAISTAVRGSLLGIVVATLAGILLYSTFTRSKKARTTLVVSMGSVLVFIFLAVLLKSSSLVQNSPYLRRITDFSSSSYTVKTRFWAWSAGLKGWSETPKTVLVGWGPENFNVPFSKYFNPKFFTGPGSETFFDRAHNMFVEVLVTMGVLGELAYLSIFVALFWTLAKFMRGDPDKSSNPDLRMLGIGFTALTIAYIIHNAFIFDTSANFITFFMLLGYVTHVSERGLDVAPNKVLPNNKLRPRPVTGFQVAAGTVLAVLTLILVYKTNIKPAKANYATTRAIVAGWQDDFMGAVNKYRESINYNTPGRYEFRNRFAQYLLDVGATSEASKIPNLKEVLLTAVEDLDHNIQENPQDYLPLLYTSRLYITLGKDDPTSPYNQKALDYSERALKISPTFVRTYYEVAQAYLNIKDYPKALEWFKKAAALNPDVGVTYWYIGIVENQMGQKQQALVDINLALEKGYSMSEGDTLKLINIYVELKDLKRVIVLYEQLTKNFPTKYEYWVQLAVAYAQDGQFKPAETAIRKALELHPNDATFRSQVEQFLKQLGTTL